MRPKHLLFAPPLVWAAAGLALLLDGRRALDYFPFLWAANDLSMMVAFAGLMLMLFGKDEPEASGVSEWPRAVEQSEEGQPLEQLLLELAARAEREAPPL